MNKEEFTMAIWDTITKKAAEISEKAVKQAKDLSEVAKLKMQIAEAEGTAESTYAQLGRLYAATHPDDYEEGFASLMAAATNAERTIKTLREQLRDAKGVAVCEKCQGRRFLQRLRRGGPQTRSCGGRGRHRAGACGGSSHCGRCSCRYHRVKP